MLGTSDPTAVEAFMRANGLSDSTIYAGEQYVMPSDADYAASTGEMGQAALNQDNARIAGNRTDQNQLPLPDVGVDLDVDVNLGFLHPDVPGSRAESLQMMDHGLMDAQRQEQLKNIAPIMEPINEWWSGVKDRGSLLVNDQLAAIGQGISNTYPFNDQITKEDVLQALNRAQEGGNLDPQAFDELMGSLPLSGVAGTTGRITSNAAKVAPDKLVSIDDLPIQPTRDIPGWSGSGPQSGVLGVNPSSTSTGALNNFTNSEGVEFIFDPTTSTFLVRGQNYQGKHSLLAESIGAPTDQVVGGILKRSDNGSFITNESSGHFWQNWTPELRENYVETMRRYGLDVKHSEGR
jgi:hypothetical protein